MTDPAQYRPAPGEIPESPGVYRFRDPHGRVVYVGKAKNLRARLSSYFQDLAALHPRTQQMVTTASSVEWTVVATEVESLQLEYSWIKEFDPRFNVKYRDDKSYPYLAITMGEEFPRVQVMRGAKRKGTRYFGPYTHAWAIRETVDLLLRVFPVRTCSTGTFKRAAQVGRPCLLGYIDRCSAPCTGAISAADHRGLAEDLADFMAGHTGRFVARVEAEMRQAAGELDFERAARLRDDLGALTTALEKSAVVLPDATDADVFALAGDELEAAVQVFHVRGGRVRGQRGWVVEKTEEVSEPDLVQQLLLQVYGDTAPEAAGADEGAAGTSSSVPREVLVPVEPSDLAQTTAWLSGLRGSAVDVRVPRRGDKRALAETVLRNAEGALKLHKSRRGGDLTTRGQALAEIQEALGLDEAPLRVECYDISHLQGTEVVASMVVFEDGLPRKAEYRRFAVRGLSAAVAAASGREVGATDDVSSMHEVITRRFRRQARDEAAAAGLGTLDPTTGELTDAPAPAGDAPQDDSDNGSMHDKPSGVAPGIDPDTGRPRRFAYAPNLVVVDGGAPQVAAAVAAMEALGVTGVAVCGLAKRLEEVWVPGEEFPVVLPRTSQGLYLLQRVRDEAHRFAITYHRSKRSKSLTVSVLDGVAGLGPARRAALLKRFGSVKRLRAASAEELQEVDGVGAATAATIVAALAAGGAQDGGPAGGDVPAVDPVTGELVDS